jgi:predicted membrane-bound mannosyltransferase
VWGVVAGAAGLATAPLEPNVLEEGIVVHTAERMLAGEHLYRDVISHTAPLPYEILALLFRVLGAEIAVARASVVVLQVVGAAAAWAVAHRAGAGALAHAAAATIAAAPILLVPLYSTYFYTTLAFYLGLVAVYIGLRGLEATRWAFAAGALLAAVALCKQSAGVAFAAAFLPMATWCAPADVRWRRLGAMTLGGGGVALLTLLLYATRGDLTVFVWSQIQLAWEMGSAETFRMPFINLWPPGELEEFARGSWALYLPSYYHMRYGLYPPSSSTRCPSWRCSPPVCERRRPGCPRRRGSTGRSC